MNRYDMLLSKCSSLIIKQGDTQLRLGAIFSEMVDLGGIRRVIEDTDYSARQIREMVDASEFWGNERLAPTNQGPAAFGNYLYVARMVDKVEAAEIKAKALIGGVGVIRAHIQAKNNARYKAYEIALAKQVQQQRVEDTRSAATRSIAQYITDPGDTSYGATITKISSATCSFDYFTAALAELENTDDLAPSHVEAIGEWYNTLTAELVRLGIAAW